MHPEGSESFNLQTAVALFRRRWGVVVLCLVVTAGSALAFSLLREKQYTAAASLLFRDPAFDQRLFGSSFVEQQRDAAREAATNVELVSLDVVAARTARLVPGDLDSEDVSERVDVSAEGQADVVSIEATETAPRSAARLANAFANQYIEFRRDADRAKIQQAQRLLRRQIAGLAPSERRGARGRSLEERASELETLAALQTGNAELVQPARPPDSASSPKPLRNGLLGGALGLVLGCALALLLERLDRRVTDPDEVGAIFDRPTLGVIPRNAELAAAGPAATSVPASVAEAFRMVRANLRYFNVDRKLRTVLVSSAAPGEGKSTVAWHLASAVAGGGAHTLLVEADLRQPSLAASVGVGVEDGLGQLLARRQEEWSDYGVREVPVSAAHGGTDGSRPMHVLFAGPPPPNPADLLESERMKQLLSAAGEEYDFVVIDTPPISVVADAIPLMREVSGLIVVARIGVSMRDALADLRGQLEQLGAPTLGVVVNSAAERGGRYGYGYERRSREAGNADVAKVER